VLQFHGNESESFCAAYRLPYIKALRVSSAESIIKAESSYRSAQALLLDTYVPGVPGGTGEVFNWGWIAPPEQRNMPIILAGGLNAQNVASALKQVAPYAVDVSGGVELCKGKKDHKKIDEFVNEVNCVDHR
ncbi:MAG: N-(5'-phosphoribosyl)anthranilate isomerase, partial [Phototrophicales bacterium]